MERLYKSMKDFISYFKKNILKHGFDYLLFLTGGIFFLISLNIFKGEKFTEFIILLIFVSFYILWGIYHHVIQDTLHFKNVLEYILIGFIAVFMIKILLFP